MERRRTSRNVHHDPLAPLRPHLIPAALTASATLALYTLAQVLPASHLSPAMSLLALAGGAAVALYARLRRPQIRPDAINAWDVSGAIVLIGFAAGMVSEPDQILALFGYPAAST